MIASGGRETGQVFYSEKLLTGLPSALALPPRPTRKEMVSIFLPAMALYLSVVWTGRCKPTGGSKQWHHGAKHEV